MRILVLHTFLLSIVFAQYDSTYLSYYPLNTGDYRQYQRISTNWEVSPIPEYSYFSTEIIGDSILPNQIQYKTIIHRSIPDTSIVSFSFERIDTSTGNVYGYYAYENKEFLIDSLQMEPGDSSNSSRSGWSESPVTICNEVYEDTVFGQPCLVKDFTDMSWYPGLHYYLATGLGLVSSIIAENWTVQTNLIFAQIDGKVYGTPLNIQTPNRIPVHFKLFQNFPNPFNSGTIIRFESLRPATISLILYDITGKKISSIYEGKVNLGENQYFFDGSEFSSGIYFYVLKSDIFYATKKCILIK